MFPLANVHLFLVEPPQSSFIDPLRFHLKCWQMSQRISLSNTQMFSFPHSFLLFTHNWGRWFRIWGLSFNRIQSEISECVSQSRFSAKVPLRTWLKFIHNGIFCTKGIYLHFILMEYRLSTCGWLVRHHLHYVRFNFTTTVLKASVFPHPEGSVVFRTCFETLMKTPFESIVQK